MSKFCTGVAALTATLMMGFTQGCGGSSPSGQDMSTATTNPQTLTLTLTVVQATVECTNLLICPSASSPQSQCYFPVDLDPSLLVAGNVLNVQGIVRSDLYNVCLGTTLQVTGAALASPSPSPSPSPSH